MINFLNKKNANCLLQNLPKYKINLSNFVNNEEDKSSLVYDAKPQVSVFQTPLLDFFDTFKEFVRRYGF